LGANQNVFYNLCEGAAGDTNNETPTEPCTTFVATCVCVNNSGTCPSASNKVTTSGVLQAAETFNSGKNGNITQNNFEWRGTPPKCPSSKPPTCGGGQTLALSGIEYDNVNIEDGTNEVGPVFIADTLSAPIPNPCS
jgi:hypothetical protein